MPFEYSEDQQFIRDEARKLLTDNYSGDNLRKLLATPGAYDEALWQKCRDMGWTGITIAEEFGGLGLSAVELCVIAEEMGRACVGMPFLLSSFGVSQALALYGSDAQKARYLPQLAAGELIGAVSLLDHKGAIRPGLSFANGQVSGVAVAVTAGLHAQLAVVLVDAGGKPALALVELTQAGVQRAALETFDNSRCIASLTFTGAAAELVGEAGAGIDAARSVLAHIAVPMTFEQIGGADRTMETARDYANERKAFGQVIGKFQAIKHCIANMYSKNEIARGNALNAALALTTGGDVLRNAAAARAAAIAAYDFAAREAIEVHGAIGATWEMDCHLHYRRARALALELGSAGLWKEQLVATLEKQGSGAQEGSVESDEVRAYRQRVRAWMAPYAAEFGTAARKGLSMDDDIALAKRWQAVKAGHGYAAINLPKQYGGGGGTEIEKIIFADEEKRFGFPSDYFVISMGMPIPIMLLWATEEQKQQLVPPAIRGETIWCQLFSEPAAGSDLAGVRLRAIRDGDNWILRGQKVWNSYAQYSDYGIIVARHDTSVAKHSGLTYFFVDMKAPGVEVRPIKLLHGHSEVNEVFFNDVVIPDSCRLGKIGDGFKIAIQTLMIERFAGADENAFGPSLAHFVELARNAEFNGRPALQSDLVRNEIAEWMILQGGARAIQSKALNAIERGAQPGPEASIFKPLLCALRSRVSTLAMDVLGPQAVIDDESLGSADSDQRAWLAVPSVRIAGGTDEMLLNTIAEKILGLPQDYRPDKGVPFDQLN
jgi:alkylation response protein AidB-like acyl-CoA dehydrogenase